MQGGNSAGLITTAIPMKLVKSGRKVHSGGAGYYGLAKFGRVFGTQCSTEFCAMGIHAQHGSMPASHTEGHERARADVLQARNWAAPQQVTPPSPNAIGHTHMFAGQLVSHGMPLAV